MKIYKKFFIIVWIILLWAYLLPWIYSTFFKDVENTTPIYHWKTRQFSMWKKIDYPEDCLKNYCDNISIKTYNFDFCVYAEVNKQEHLKYWLNFNFFEDRIITSDIMQRREHYVFKSDCDYLEWEKIYNNQKSF